jgi:hypothetical protein
MTLYIWRLEQNKNNGYNTYDSCVVVSESEEKAKQICPDEFYKFHTERKKFIRYDDMHGWMNYVCGSWSSPDVVHATKLGIAENFLEEGQIISSSFNAG